eukprot:295093-Chlamydomonas_euryale.AAC.1
MPNRQAADSMPNRQAADAAAYVGNQNGGSCGVAGSDGGGNGGSGPLRRDSSNGGGQAGRDGGSGLAGGGGGGREEGLTGSAGGEVPDRVLHRKYTIRTERSSLLFKLSVERLEV